MIEAKAVIHDVGIRGVRIYIFQRFPIIIPDCSRRNSDGYRGSARFTVAE